MVETTQALELLQHLRKGKDKQGCLNILMWELGDLSKAIQYSKWHPHLEDGYRGEAKLALAAILFQSEALCGMYGWTLEEIRDLGFDQIRDRIKEKEEGKGRFEHYVEGENKELENLVSSDLLTRLFNTQRSLMEKYKDIESETGLLPTRKIPVDLDSYKGQERIRQAMWNIVAELGEFAEGLNYKPWKLDPDPVDREYLYNEIGDLIHFVLEFLILIGITPEKLGDIYFKMVRKNKERQEGGY